MIDAAMSTLATNDTGSDQCYRCDYQLHGILDEQPCPECGLLAGRSRRHTDELHNTRPRWLSTLSRGVFLILIALLIAMSWPFFYWQFMLPGIRWTGFFGMLYYASGTQLSVLGFDIAAIVLMFGIWLLATREGYEPADRQDREYRIWLRVAAFAPLFGMTFMHIYLAEIVARAWTNEPEIRWLLWTAILFLSIGSMPIPLLICLRMRSVAWRARSAHLAEHCVILGLGTAATLLLLPAVCILMEYGNRWIGSNWTNNSTSSLLLILTLIVAGMLFWLWSVYLLIRFAVAFRRASRELKQKWKRSDHAIAPA